MGWKDQVSDTPPAAAPTGGWRDQSEPAVAPTPDSKPVDDLVKSSPYLKEAKNPYEAFLAGLQMSASVIPFHEPNMAVPKNASFASKVMSAIGQGAGDIPASIAGFFAGGAAGAAAGAAVPGAGETGVSEAVGAVAGAGAGTTATPQAVREVMMDYYAHRNDRAPMTASDFMGVVAHSAWNITKAGAVGAVGGAVGGKVAGVVGEAGGSAFSQTAANAAGFTLGSTAAQATLEGKMPDAQDFAANSIAALVMAGATHYAATPYVRNAATNRVEENLQGIYRQTGIPPWEATHMANGDPVFHQEIFTHDVNGDPVLPKFNANRPPEVNAEDHAGTSGQELTTGPSLKNASDFGLGFKQTTEEAKSKGLQPFHKLIMDGENPVGGLMGHFDPATGDIRVDSINTATGAGTLGSAKIRSILKELTAEFPDAKTVSGLRTSGARPEKAEASINLQDEPTGPKNALTIKDEHEAHVQSIVGDAHIQKHVEQLLPQVRALEDSGDKAVSPRGAIGRYQIMPGTARQYGFDPAKLTDPVYNEKVARTVLADLSRRFNGDTEAVLVAYNAGPGRAMSFVRAGRDTTTLPFETQKYLEHAGFGGKGGKPPEPPIPPEEPPAQPEGENPNEVPSAREQDFSKLTDEMMVSRFQDAIGEGPSRPSTGGNIMRQWVSELESARSIDRQITAKGLQDPNVDLTFEDMMRQTYASDDRTNYMLMHGNIDAITLDGKEGPSLVDVLNKVREAGGNMDEFDAFRVAQRTLDLDKRGIDTGVFKGGVAEAGNVVQRENFQKYKAINDAMQEWKRGGLEYGRDSGLWTDERIAAMEAASSHVSLRRIMGDDKSFKTVMNGPRGLKVSNPLKAMEGSDRQIVKPLLADIDNMRQIIRMADRNRAIGHLLGGQDALTNAQRKTLEDIGIRMLPAPEIKAMLAEPGSSVFKPYSMTPEQEAAALPFANVSDKNLMGGNRFLYYRNGKAEIWEASDPDVAALIRGAENLGDATTISVFGHIINLDKILSTPAKLERAGIMGNLDTALTVPGKHQLTAWALDPLHPPPYITMVKGLHDVLAIHKNAPPKGFVRLYRGETNTSKPDAPVPDWIKGTDKYKETVEATGRWFSRTKEEAQYYVNTFGGEGSHITYVDVPKEKVEDYLSANQPGAKRFSAPGRENSEYFVPKEIASKRKILSDKLTKGDAYWDLMRRGGLSGALTDMDMAKVVDKALDDQDVLRETGALENTWNSVKHPLEFAQHITEALTEAERIGYYKRAVAQGMDPNKAAMMGRRAYLDFSERAAGVISNRMAKNIPFFRAALLGVKYVRDGFQADPVGSALRVTIGLVGSQMALYALNRKTDEYLPPDQRYTSLPQWERDMYYITPPINGVRYKLGRPYVIGPLLSVPLERTMERMFENDPHAYDNFLSDWLGREILPSPIPAAVKPALEQVTNHNFFTGKPLVSDQLREATPDQQYHENTTEVAKKISSLIGSHTGLGIGEVSPIVLDNYVQAWGGTVGMTVLHALDAPLGKPAAESDFKDNVFIRGFVIQNPRMGTQQIDDFYKDAEKFQQLHRDVALEKKGGDIDQATADATAVGRKAQMTVKIEHALAVQRTALKALASRKDMTLDEKRQLSQRIYSDAWNLAKFGSNLLADKPPSEEETSQLSDTATKNVEAAVGEQTP